MIALHKKHLISLLALIFSLVLISAVQAWTGPTQAPPDGNVDAPINVGITDQIKSAGLGVDALSVFGNAILAGTSNYLNFGSTAGVNGYGIRDNGGYMEVKDVSGTWGRFATTTGTSGGAGAQYQVFNSSGTWTKPSTGTVALIECWGGGGGGGRDSGTYGPGGGGGGGGGYGARIMPLSSLSATVAVVVGSGGSGISTNGSGGNGGNSSFGSYLYAYGGAGGGTSSSYGWATGGGGGGQISAASTYWPGEPRLASSAGCYVGGGEYGSGADAVCGASDGFYHGGGGGGGSYPGDSVYGGGGGSGAGARGGGGGISVAGGNGGTGNNSSCTSGTQPGGGGGGTKSVTSCAGAAGRCSVVVW